MSHRLHRNVTFAIFLTVSIPILAFCNSKPSFAQAVCRFASLNVPSIVQSRDGAWQISNQGGACQATFSGGGVANYSKTSMNITEKPANGTLVLNSNGFTYTAKSGYSGKDEFIIRICGKSSVGSGCANVTYKVVN